MVRAVILDAYGTILDTGDGSVRATERILRSHGSALDPAAVYAAWKRFHRQHIAQLREFENEERLFRRDLERVHREYRLSGELDADLAMMLSTLGTRPAFPEAAAAIAELRKRWRVYVGSNSDSTPLAADIERNRLAVDGVFCSESLRAYKPAALFFERLLARIVCIPEEVVYVGDSLDDDIGGAAAVGIRAVWVDRKGQAPPPGSPAPTRSVGDLSLLARELTEAWGEENVARPLGCEQGIPVFGRPESEAGPIERPGAYALVHDDAGRLALVRVGSDWFLPGGGIEQGEEPPEALERELREEIGLRPTGLSPLGEAIEYWRSPVSGRALRTHAHFFDVTAYTPAGAQAGSDPHAWVDPREAVRRLLRPAQQWYARRYGAGPQPAWPGAPPPAGVVP